VAETSTVRARESADLENDGGDDDSMAAGAADIAADVLRVGGRVGNAQIAVDDAGSDHTGWRCLDDDATVVHYQCAWRYIRAYQNRSEYDSGINRASHSLANLSSYRSGANAANTRRRMRVATEARTRWQPRGVGWP
jgi:hypothetical protein